MDKLERKIDNTNKVQVMSGNLNSPKTPKVRDIKKEIEEMRAKHMSKLSAIKQNDSTRI